MKFKENLESFIKILESSPEFRRDKALQKVVEILKNSTSEKELHNHVPLLRHITIDSVENQETANKLFSFLEPYS